MMILFQNFLTGMLPKAVLPIFWAVLLMFAALPAHAADIGYDKTNSNQAESDGAVTVDLMASGNVNRDTLVTYTISGTSNNSDHDAVDGSVYILNGTSTASISFNLLEDTVYEDDETVLITITSVGTGSTIAAQDLHTMTIADNDAVPSLSLQPVDAAESSGATQIRVESDTVAAFDINFSYSTTDGTAVAGTNYTSTSGSGTITAGSMTATISVPVTDAQNFQAAWGRVSKHFNLLFTTVHSINKLKETVLQLAIMGKLVPQDPSDEHASALLKRIEVEKERLIKKGEIKKPKPLSRIATDPTLLKLPPGWAQVYCQDICYKITDGEHATPNRAEKGYYLLSARNVTNSGIKLHDVDYVPEDEFQRIRRRCDPNLGDILISCSGSIGRIAMVDKDNTYCMVRSAAMIRPDAHSLNVKYLAWLLRSPYLQSQMKEKSRQSAQPNLFLGAISTLIMLIPPLAEQNRIVAKVEELINLCDQLTGLLQKAQGTQIKLTDAVVENAL